MSVNLHLLYPLVVGFNHGRLLGLVYVNLLPTTRQLAASGLRGGLGVK